MRFKSGVKNKLQIAPNEHPYDYDVSRYDKEVAGLCRLFVVYLSYKCRNGLKIEQA